MSLSTSGYLNTSHVALDGGGNVVVGGDYQGSFDFDPSNGTTTLPTVGGGYIAKLSSTGALVWAKVVETARIAGVHGLAVDAFGSIYATGTFVGTVDLDPGAGTQIRTTVGSFDILALKLAPDGNFIWGTTIGGTDLDFGRSIAVDTAGTVYLAGGYQGTVDFDPIGTYWLTNPGTFSNLYLVKLKQP